MSAGVPDARGASTVSGMVRSLLLAVLVALAAAGTARAQTVTLWGCHGPGGEPLPFAYDASTTTDTSIGPASGVSVSG